MLDVRVVQRSDLVGTKRNTPNTAPRISTGDVLSFHRHSVDSH